MKKHIIAFVLVSSLLLASCSIDWNDEKDKKIGELEKQIVSLKKEKEDDLFKKKQECEKYKEDIIQKINKNNSDMRKMNYMDSYNEYFVEIFYSQKKQSCFVVSEILQVMKGWNKEENMSIYNILTNEVSIYEKWKPLFYKKLEELKQQ